MRTNRRMPAGAPSKPKHLDICIRDLSDDSIVETLASRTDRTVSLIRIAGVESGGGQDARLPALGACGVLSRQQPASSRRCFSSVGPYEDYGDETRIS